MKITVEIVADRVLQNMNLIMFPYLCAANIDQVHTALQRAVHF